jgi:hypothetical protein
MLFRFVPAKNHTSGPKGRKDDNVCAGDKSPAYPKTEFPQPVAVEKISGGLWSDVIF